MYHVLYFYFLTKMCWTDLSLQGMGIEGFKWVLGKTAGYFIYCYTVLTFLCLYFYLITLPPTFLPLPHPRPLPNQPHFNVFTTYLVKKNNEVLLKCYSIAFRCATHCLLGGLNYFAKNTCQIKGVIYMNIFIYIININIHIIYIRYNV